MEVKLTYESGNGELGHVRAFGPSYEAALAPARVLVPEGCAVLNISKYPTKRGPGSEPGILSLLAAIQQMKEETRRVSSFWYVLESWGNH